VPLFAFKVVNGPEWLSFFFGDDYVITAKIKIFAEFSNVETELQSAVRKHKSAQHIHQPAPDINGSSLALLGK